MASRSEAAEKLLAEARGTCANAKLKFEVSSSGRSKARSRRNPKMRRLPIWRRTWPRRARSHAEVDAVRAALEQRSAELAKALEAKDAALQRAEQKIATVEGRIAEQDKAIDAEREEFEERLAKLKEQLEAEQAARAFAEGALQAARQERGSRRHDAEGAAAPKDPQPPASETARDKIARLRG